MVSLDSAARYSDAIPAPRSLVMIFGGEELGMKKKRA
jgi:hypothetical protein